MAGAAVAASMPGSNGWVAGQPEAPPASVWTGGPTAAAVESAIPSPSNDDEHRGLDGESATDLAAALRAQQEQLQKQWQQQTPGSQGQVWAAPAPETPPLPAQHEATKAVLPAAEQGEATVDELLALMGLA